MSKEQIFLIALKRGLLMVSAAIGIICSAIDDYLNRDCGVPPAAPRSPNGT
jgi:hypothetical protein